MAVRLPGFNQIQKEVGSWFGRKKKDQPDIPEGDILGGQTGNPYELPSGKEIFGENPLIKFEDFYKPVNVENPYADQLKAALGQNMVPDFTQAQGTAGQQNQFAQALQGLYGTGASGLTGLIGTLQRQQSGDFGPGGSLAQKVLEQGLGQNIAGVRSQLASQRGLNPALAARYAAQQTAQLGGQTAQQAGILGLQQQLQAQQLLGQLTSGAAQLGSKAGEMYGQMRGQDIAQATASSDAALNRLGILASSDTGIRQLQAQTGMGENELRAKIAAANQAAKMGDRQMAAGILGGILGGASSIGAAYAGNPKNAYMGGRISTPGGWTGGDANNTPAYAAYGGRINGKAIKPGDHPDNDIVPAKLSPGEIVIPRSAAGSREAAKSFIDSLDDFDDEPSYGKVLKARQKKNYADGGVVEPDLDKEMAEYFKKIDDKYRTQQLKKMYEEPIPQVERFKQGLDTMLTERVVEPLARRGYPNLGAGIATVPSTLAEALLPSSMAEMQTVIPFPGAKLSKAAKEVLKEQGNEPLLDKMGRKIKEAAIEETPKSSLEKGGWYDQIGGKTGLTSKLDDLVKANPDDRRIESMVKRYREHLKASESGHSDLRTNQMAMAERKLENLIDYIDRNLDRFKMPSDSADLVKKKIAIETPSKPNSERYPKSQNIFKDLPEPDREKVFVYRVEDENGKGPWQSKKSLQAEEWYDQPETKINYFMEPDESNIHKIGPYLEWAEDEGSEQFLYGFKDLEQLNRYFSPTELQKLEKQGFKIVKVKADKTFEGDSQLIFMPYLED